MTFDFDKVFDRRHTDSLKWDKYKSRDVIPMWVADMDFPSPAPVLEALHKRVNHGIFGYTAPPDELVQVVVTRMWEKYQWKVKPSWIIWLPGVVPALHLACLAFGNDGDEVLTFTPAYPPFLSAPALCKQQLKPIPLLRQVNRFTMDAERFKSAITPRSKVLLLCNPHNPVGRRYDHQELSDIAEICIERNVVICSDEIHCDLILDGQKHIPTATLSPEISTQTITLMAPSKIFNTPGLNCAFAIIENKDLRTKFRHARKGIVPGVNALGFSACLADGREYGGEGYVRLNFGCPRKTLTEALERMQSAVKAFVARASRP